MLHRKTVVELIGFLFIFLILIYTFIGVCYYTFKTLNVIVSSRYKSVSKVIENISWFIFSVLLITLIFATVVIILGVRK